MLKELKEDVEKVNKMMYEQYGSINKRDRKPKKKPQNTKLMGCNKSISTKR